MTGEIKEQVKSSKNRHPELDSGSPDLTIPKQVRNDKRQNPLVKLGGLLVLVISFGVYLPMVSPFINIDRYYPANPVTSQVQYSKSMPGMRNPQPVEA